jgi:hypothetical protein
MENIEGGNYLGNWCNGTGTMPYNHIEQIKTGQGSDGKTTNCNAFDCYNQLGSKQGVTQVRWDNGVCTMISKCSDNTPSIGYKENCDNDFPNPLCIDKVCDNNGKISSIDNIPCDNIKGCANNTACECFQSIENKGYWCMDSNAKNQHCVNTPDDCKTTYNTLVQKTDFCPVSKTYNVGCSIQNFLGQDKCYTYEGVQEYYNYSLGLGDPTYNLPSPYQSSCSYPFTIYVENRLNTSITLTTTPDSDSGGSGKWLLKTIPRVLYLLNHGHV